MDKGSLVEINHLSVDYPVPLKLFGRKKRRDGEQQHQKRRYRALHDMSLTVNPGEHVGVVGVNGAGKTTFFRALAGILNAATGSIFIDGKGAMSPDRSPVGYMAAYPLIYRRLTGYDNLKFIADLYHLADAEIRIKRIADLVGLTGMLDKYVEEYSTGMAARLDFARTLLPEPSLLILDEPFSSFDLHFADEARKYIRESKATVIMATHNLDDIETLTERLLLLHRGELIRDISFNDLSEVAPTHMNKKTLSIVEFVQSLLRRTVSTEFGNNNSLYKKHVLSA